MYIASSSQLICNNIANVKWSGMGGWEDSGERQVQQNDLLPRQVDWLLSRIGYLGACQQPYSLRTCHPLVLIEGQETAQEKQKEQKTIEAWQIISQKISWPCQNGNPRWGHFQIGLALFPKNIQKRRTTDINRASLWIIFKTIKEDEAQWIRVDSNNWGTNGGNFWNSHRKDC